MTSSSADAAARVLLAVGLVPPGRVASYGDIARVVGVGPRQVGAVLRRGGGDVPWWRIVAHDEPARLKQQVPGGQIRLQFATPARVAHARLVLADEWPPAERAPQQPAGADTTTLQIDLPATGTVPALRALLDRLDDQDVPVDHVEVSAPDLDDVFFALTSTTTRKAMQ